MVIIDFGCGNSKTTGTIGVDFNPRTEADVIHNLNEFPYPFPDNYADHIICNDVLEHVEDFIKVIEELWRIGKPGCEIKVTGPFMSSVNYFSDPTHRRSFTSRSFDYFIKDAEKRRYSYSPVEFELLSVEYDPDQIKVRQGFHLWMLRWANKNKKMYEDRYAFIYPVYQIHFLLKTLK